MTDRVNPSASGLGQAYMLAKTIEQFGAVGDGWIAPSTDDYAATHPNSNLSVGGSALNAFAYILDDSDPPTVTFATGEAFIGGSWVARDETTEIELEDNTANQTVYVGWDYADADTVKIGVPEATPGDSFNDFDPRIPLYKFDTSNGAVIDDEDLRQLGKNFDIDEATIGSGSEIGQFSMTGFEEPNGEPGRADGEVWRAGSGSGTDVIFSTGNVGGDRAVWSCNAEYYDDAWRYTTGGRMAYRLAMHANVTGETRDDIGLFVAPSGTEGDEITWTNAIVLDSAEGWRDINGDLVYDESAGELQQSQMESPPGDLTSYPLPATDIDDGDGSGLDADTLDGLHADDFQQGGWELIDTHEDTDEDSSPSPWYDFSPSTTYDVYRVDIFIEHCSEANEIFELHARINNDASSNYYSRVVDWQNLTHAINEGLGHWPDIVFMRNQRDFAYSQLMLSCPTKVGTNGTDQHRPKASLSYPSHQFDTQHQFVQGEFDKDVAEIDSIQLLTEPNSDAVGKVRTFGRDVSPTS